MNLPRHISLMIEHQPHALNYESVEDYLKRAIDLDWHNIEEADRIEMLETSEIWVIRWYPNSPVGQYSVAAATYERALELVQDPGYR